MESLLTPRLWNMTNRVSRNIIFFINTVKVNLPMSKLLHYKVISRREELLNQMWMIKEVFFQETVCKWKSFQEDNEGFVNGPEKPPI